MRARTRQLVPASVVIRVAACLAGAAGITAGCGSDASPPISLFTTADWKDNPGSLDEIGYRVTVDFGWPSRAQSCFPLPSDLTVSVNEREVTPTELGECVWDILVEFDAVPPDTPVHVRVAGGGRIYGEATYDDLFPGFGAQLTPAGDGTVHANSPFTILLPSTVSPVATDLGAGNFYWLDIQPPEVPYFTFGPGTYGPDPQRVAITAPGITGRATLIVKDVFEGSGLGTARSCTGFDSCPSLPASLAAGPIAVNVVP